MDYLQLIRRPIEDDIADFRALFAAALTSDQPMLADVLAYIRARKGKQMRPMLILLTAKAFGEVNSQTLNAAVGLELLHTASLVHDDVVDESGERRGQKSVNAEYDNKVAVLVGDYLLSTALLHVAMTGNRLIVEYLARLGRTLSAGEILQLSNLQADDLSETVYYDIIRRKTAALFEACCAVGAISAGASEREIEAAKLFGTNLGIAFQIRDDIFDYYPQQAIGKPTGNDMAEGKLTLPALYAVNHTADPQMQATARRVKDLTASKDDIAALVSYTIEHGGIEYAEQAMRSYAQRALDFITERVTDPDIAQALRAYLDLVVERDK